MEFFFLIVEGLLWILDVTVIGADVYSWFKGKPNRVERRVARKAGQEPPPRDVWNRRVIALTLIVVITTMMLVIWKSREEPDPASMRTALSRLRFF